MNLKFNSIALLTSKTTYGILAPPFDFFSVSACCGWAQISHHCHCHRHSPVRWPGRACLGWHINPHAMLCIECLCLRSAPWRVALHCTGSYHPHMRIEECLYCLAYYTSNTFSKWSQSLHGSSVRFTRRCVHLFRYVSHHSILELQFKHPTDMKPTSALLKIEFQRKTLQLESTCLLG